MERKPGFEYFSSTENIITALLIPILIPITILES